MNDRGASRMGVTVLVEAVLVMWQRDRQSQDVDLDVDIGLEVRTTDGSA